MKPPSLSGFTQKPTPPSYWGLVGGDVGAPDAVALLEPQRVNRAVAAGKMVGATDFEDFRRADICFHTGIAEAARSPRLVRAMTEVQGQMSDRIALIAHPDQVLTHSNGQQRRLVKLLGRRDGVRAVGLMREHIASTEHILAGLV
jgi:DNA-binding GntR family transcriptional regulator